MEREVLFSPEAADDLLNIYDYIAERASRQTALGYVERIEAFCNRLGFASERGTKRDDLRPGLRIIGFERRVTIAFHVEPRSVIVDRAFYAGRDIPRAFGIFDEG